MVQHGAMPMCRRSSPKLTVALAAIKPSDDAVGCVKFSKMLAVVVMSVGDVEPPTRCKGLGERTAVSVAPAGANAVFHPTANRPPSSDHYRKPPLNRSPKQTRPPLSL